MNGSPSNPYVVLGLKAGASSEEVRRAYLMLVRQYPPDRDPDKFRQIHDAYQALSDPLNQARAILKPSREPLPLLDVISAAEKERPRLPKLVLLALGNPE